MSIMEKKLGCPTLKGDLSIKHGSQMGCLSNSEAIRSQPENVIPRLGYPVTRVCCIRSCGLKRTSPANTRLSNTSAFHSSVRGSSEQQKADGIPCGEGERRLSGLPRLKRKPGGACASSRCSVLWILHPFLPHPLCQVMSPVWKI